MPLHAVKRSWYGSLCHSNGKLLWENNKKCWKCVFFCAHVHGTQATFEHSKASMGSETWKYRSNTAYWKSMVSIFRLDVEIERNQDWKWLEQIHVVNKYRRSRNKMQPRIFRMTSFQKWKIITTYKRKCLLKPIN